MQSPTQGPKISQKTARDILWSKGNIAWKLDNLQQEIRQAFYKSNHKINVWLMSRRLGKSHLLCALAIEQCIKKPGSIVKYLAPEGKQVKTIIKPIISDLTSDCPEDLRPQFKTQEMLYRFPNGSEIHLAGSDGGGAEKLRGTKADLCIVDEAGFCNELKYAVRTILLPTMLTTGGKMVLSSTPPAESAHEFLDFIEEADAKETLIKKTVYDCPRYSKEFIEREILSQYPSGAADPEFRREYMVEILKDENLAVVPEFTEDLEKRIVVVPTMPSHYDAYVSADWGVSDLTVILFAVYDFKNSKVHILDELIMNGAKMNTAILAEKIKQKEKTLWHDQYTLEPKPVYMRVADNNLLLIQDMQTLHNLNFIPTEKTDKHGALNNLRILLQSERVIIHPRCVTLKNHLKYATWDKNRRTYKRSAQYGHYDAIDALTYLIRNIIWSHNPYPKDVHGDNVFVNESKKPEVSTPAAQFKTLFKPRRF
jgi:hypothetical protein